MRMAYSLDFHTRVLSAVHRGLSRTEAAKQFELGRATITTRQPRGLPGTSPDAAGGRLRDHR